MSELVSAISRQYQSGDDLLLRIVVTDINGDSVDLTGMSFVFMAAREGGFDAVISTDDTVPTATIVETDAAHDIALAEGTYGVSIEGSVTADLVGTYTFVSKVTDALSNVATVVRGYLTFVPSL